MTTLLQLGANDLIKCENLVASVKHFVSESHNLFFFSYPKFKNVDIYLTEFEKIIQDEVVKIVT